MPAASKPDRYFYTTVASLFLILTAVGFHHFLLEGKEPEGGAIPTPILAIVIIHGLALLVWIVLFFVQSLLIASRNRSLHMKLGWVAAIDAALIALSGPLLAVNAIRTRPTVHLFGMTYPQFLLPMLTEIAAFTAFVALGLWFRRKPAVHRSMMLLATLSVLSGSTSRMGLFDPLFGTKGWAGIFGAVFAIAAVILVARCLLTRRIDWPLAVGATALGAVYAVVMRLALSDGWTEVAHRIARG
jgi:hypothetical protein